MMTDPVADMLTRIRNASSIGKKEVIFPFSKMKFGIAGILEEEEYIQSVEKIDKNYGEIRVVLKYDKDKKSQIRSIQRISKPGKRVYVNKDEIPNVLNNLGIAVISTSQGLLTNKEAKKRKLGGEVICEIY